MLFFWTDVASSENRKLIWPDELYTVGEECAYVSVTLPGELGTAWVYARLIKRDAGVAGWKWELLQVNVQSALTAKASTIVVLDNRIIYPNGMTQKV